RSGTPSTATVPATGRSRPAIVRSSVLLPAPEGPVTASIRPGRATADTWCSTVWSRPYAAVTASTVSVVIVPPQWTDRGRPGGRPQPDVPDPPSRTHAAPA